MQEVIKMLIIIKFTFYLVIVDNAQLVSWYLWKNTATLQDDCSASKEHFREVKLLRFYAKCLNLRSRDESVSALTARHTLERGNNPWLTVRHNIITPITMFFILV